MASPYDKRARSALGELAPMLKPAGALPSAGQGATGALPSDIQDFITKHTPQPPAPPPPPNTMQRIAGALVNTFTGAPDPTKPRSTGQMAYDNAYNVLVKAPTKSYQQAKGVLSEAVNADPASYGIGPGINEIVQKGDIALQALNTLFSPFAGAAKEFGQQLVPGADPQASLEGRPTSPLDTLSAGLGFVGENAAYMAPIPGLGGARAAKAAEALERTRALEKITRADTARDLATLIDLGKLPDPNTVIAAKPFSLPVISAGEIRGASSRVADMADAEAVAQQLAKAKPVDPAMLEKAARLDQIEQQLVGQEFNTPEVKALRRRRDELLANTTPEQLRAAQQEAERQRVLRARASRLPKVEQSTQRAPAKPVEPVAEAPAPQPEPTPVERWETLYDENDKPIGEYNRRSGQTRPLAQGQPEAAAEVGVSPSQTSPREVVAQPDVPPPAQAVPPASPEMSPIADIPQKSPIADIEPATVRAAEPQPVVDIPAPPAEPVQALSAKQIAAARKAKKAPAVEPEPVPDVQAKPPPRSMAQAERVPNPQTKTPEFKKWFGDSKVVDRAGEPLVVYHGTASAISEFSPASRGASTAARSARLGYWFTNDQRVAGSYAQHAAVDAPVHKLIRDADRAGGRGDWKEYDAKIIEAEKLEKDLVEPDNRLRGQNVVPTYLSIKNPKVIDAKGAAFSELDENLTEQIRAAQRAGHDGVIVKNLDDAAGLTDAVADHYLVFSPKQIKSAIGNRGTFDPENPSILAQAGDGIPRKTNGGGERVKIADGLLARHIGETTPEEARLLNEVDKLAERIAPKATVKAYRALEIVPESSFSKEAGLSKKQAGKPEAQSITGANYASGMKQLVAWSLESPDAVGTVRHEMLHYLRGRGLINPGEWRALDKAVDEQGWIAKHKIEERYPGGENWLKREESIAEEFAQWRRSDSVPKVFRPMWTRISRFMGRVADAARRVMGKEVTANDVFSRMERGEVGKRAGARREGEPTFAQVQMRDQRTFNPSPFTDIVTNPPRSMREELVDDTRSLISNLKGAVSKQAINESIDRTRTALQDRFLPLLRTQKAIEKQLGRKLAESENPYLGEELSTGRKGAKLEDLTENMVRPLFTAMHESKVTPEELETYLYARHAPERNAQIQKINQKFGQGNPTLFDREKSGSGGSGMTDGEAAAVMQAVEQSGKKEALEALAKRVDDVLALGLKERVESGLMSKDDAARWQTTYKHYVPLKGFAELEGVDPGEAVRPRTGGSFNIRGQESQRAFGRETKAADILAHAIMQTEEAIVRGESNRVAQQIYNLAKELPHGDFWKIDKTETKPVFLESTGQVDYRPTKQLTELDRDYTVSLKIDGEQHTVTFNRNNPVARRLAESLKNLKGDQVSLAVQTFGRLNRYLSHVNTTLNPEFVISNAFRDIQEATVNLQQYDMKGLTKKTLKHWPGALKAATRGAFHKGDGEWATWWKEFREDGARTYFNQVDDLKAQRLKIEREYKLAKPGLHPIDMPGTSARKVMRNVLDFIENVNLGVENGIRLASYRAAREGGMTRAEAASLAKNLTINFNRRGTYGPLLNSMYLFYNASVQGTAIMLSAMKSSRVRKVVGGAVATGAMLEMLNSMTSGKDKDGELFYDKIDDYTKTHNLIVMDPTSDDGRYIKLPLPYGYGSFFAMGRSAGELYRGKPVTQIGTNLIGAISDAFNPIGGSGDSLLKLVSPTIMDPMVELATNKDYRGKAIVPEQSEYGPEKPQSQMYWNSTALKVRQIASLLNSISGGDEVKPGAIDVSPEVLDYMWGEATGAAGSFVLRNANLVDKIFDPTSEMSWDDFPMARRLVGGKSTWYDKQMFFERAKEIEQELAYVKDYARRGDIGKAKKEVADYHDLLALSGLANQARQSLSAIRQARSQLIFQHDLGRISDSLYTLRIKRLKDSEAAVLTQFNKAYISTTRPAYVPKPEGEAPTEKTQGGSKAEKQAALTQSIKNRDFASLDFAWAPDDAATAARRAGMPATARILGGTGSNATSLSMAA